MYVQLGQNDSGIIVPDFTPATPTAPASLDIPTGPLPSAPSDLFNDVLPGLVPLPGTPIAALDVPAPGMTQQQATSIASGVYWGISAAGRCDGAGFNFFRLWDPFQCFWPVFRAFSVLRTAARNLACDRP